MKKAFVTTLFSLLTFSLSAQLSDDQVISLIWQSSERGMGQTEIVAELLSKGVTQQQLLRIRDSATQNGSLSSGSYSSSALNASGDDGRLRTNPTQNSADAPGLSGMSGLSGTSGMQNMQSMQGLSYLPFFRDSTELEKERPENRIFGHSVFSKKRLTFEPSLNIATPENYMLGPGDEVIIDIWGDSQQTIRQKISPDGHIVINRLGPVMLSGFTVKEADSRLKQSFARIYSSVGGDRPATFTKLSLGQIRSIQVHVMGEVVNPGTYTVSSLSSLFHVLYSAGGVNEIGSLRHVSLCRGGEQIADVDVYAYLLRGETGVDIGLKDGDVVVVSPYRNLVHIAGNVKRPMKYEMRDGETLGGVLGFSGGFTGDSYKDAVTVVRRSGRLQQVHNIGKHEYEKFVLADGDSISVGAMIDRFHNRIEVTGAVFRPGLYAVSDSVSTVSRLIRQADGLRGDAFTTRAVLTREKPDYSLEALSVDVGAIMSGKSPDIELRNNDRLHVPSISELREEYRVTIQGAVRYPGEYEYADNLSIEDMIIKAGGLLESASTYKVDVYRRIKNPASFSESEMRSESFTFSIRDGLGISGYDGFALQPFDIVTVRTSPGYEAQKAVTIYGEVLFPGSYTLVKREERLSDLMRMSGGALSSAYISGASLVRRMNEKERTRMQSALRLAELGGLDSLNMKNLNVEQTYSVGIELDKAMADPGSDYDLVLEEGDVLQVPGYVGTVAISGAVLFPNTVSFREGMRIKDYIDQAGGHIYGARKGGTIVIYMNGTIARMKRNGVIAPGCEIVVPYRSNRQSRVSATEILGLGSSATSMAALVTSLITSMR